MVVLPQPLSPTRPSVSPAATVKLTPSTAWTTRRAGAGRSAASRPRREREVLDQVRPPRAAAPRHHRPARWQAARWPAPTRRSAGALDRAARLGERAARMEAAARRQRARAPAWRRRWCRGASSPSAPGRHVDERAGVGMRGGAEDARDRRLLDDPAGVHHEHAVAHLRDDAEVVRDEEHGHAQLARQPADQRQHLGLDGHVERGGRLVRDQQARARRRCPCRSSRAGPCRR